MISFDTEEAARKELRKLRVRAEKEASLTAGQAIDRYEKLLASNGLKAGSAKTTGFRLRRLFKSVLATPLALLTPVRARELITALPGSVDVPPHGLRGTMAT